MPKKITIRDVAKEAGVSVSAVSRVFNNYGDISEATREKIYAAARRLEYVPNQAARKLSSKNKKIIALILNEITADKGVTMPLELLSGVSNYLQQTDYEFVFYGTSKQKQEEKSLKQFCTEHSISGFLIQGLKTTDPYYKELETLTHPAIAIDLMMESNPKIGTISVDNIGAAREVTQRLVAAGYQNILFVNGTRYDDVSQKREEGYCSVCGDAEIVYADFSEDRAYQLILAKENLEDVDAIFAASDLMAIGAIKALREREMSIPIVGFDDNVLASYVTPTLTTVRQDIALLSECAVQDLLLLIETGQVTRRILPYEIVVRESAKF